jgi:uncharacterized protein YigA (DUF484 family)
MSIIDRFHRVRDAREDDRSAEALPTTLVESCRDLFELDGVGISLTEEVRVPLAATSVDAVTAEALQTTLGEGPCLTAATHGTALVADASSMAATWPLFGAALTSGTRFRSVASVPLRAIGGSPFGAVDLYSVDAESTTLDAVINDAAQLGQVMGDSLIAATSAYGLRSTMSRWTRSPSANARFVIWSAVGMMMAHAGEPSRDALARLRGYAFSHNLSLDELASRLANRQLRPESIT